MPKEAPRHCRRIPFIPLMYLHNISQSILIESQEYPQITPNYRQNTPRNTFTVSPNYPQNMPIHAPHTFVTLPFFLLEFCVVGCVTVFDDGLTRRSDNPLSLLPPVNEDFIKPLLS